MTQPQLLNMSLKPSDVVYTPDDVARDVVNFFKPSGRILEPSAGDGAFLRYLPPHTEWCEIEKGRDFFAWRDSVDWCIGNPPYSIFSDWLRHSFEIADNICYVIPVNKLFNSHRTMKEISDYGGVRTIYVFAQQTFKDYGWTVNFAMGAVHLQRNYRGGTFTVFRGNT